MKKVLIAAFAAGFMATAVNAQTKTAPAAAKVQTTTTTAPAAEKKMVEKKEMAATAKPAKHHKAAHVHAVKNVKPASN